MRTLRKLTFGAAGTAVFAAALLIGVRAHNDVKPSDTAAYYKAKCGGCHGHKAEKKFVASDPDDKLIDAVLNGKKAAKPPNMPGYKGKGVTSEEAKNLVDYMKQLRAGH
jgi:mono/diheme cytochrome c family protein